MALSDDKFLFLDLQTTGHAPPTACVVEAAWATASARDAVPTVTRRFVRLAEGVRLPREVRKLTGLSPEALDGAPRAPDVYRELCDAAAGETLSGAVIHYARFELPFLAALAEECGGRGLGVAFFCTHRIARRLFPSLPAWGLRAVSGYLGHVTPEAHRACDHVVATHAVWRGLVGALEEQGVTTREALARWLEAPHEKARPRKRAFLLPRETRLKLPRSPGVYRMLSRAGTVLYVGKATSLKDRVGSYFVGRTAKGKVAELVAQVGDVQVTPTESALEAALLEADEIKRWEPAYNSLLRAGERRIVYLSSDALRSSSDPGPEFPLGPFSSPFALDSFARLCRVASGEAPPELFHPDLLEPDLFFAGRDLFFARHGMTAMSAPSWLTLGKRLSRGGIDPEEAPEVPDDEDDDRGVEEALTPERVADRISRTAQRAAGKIREARWILRLADSLVVFGEAPGGPATRWLLFERGAIVERGTLPDPTLTRPLPLPASSRRPLSLRKAELDLVTFDRLRVLVAGLRRIVASGAALRVKVAPGRSLVPGGLRASSGSLRR